MYCSEDPTQAISQALSKHRFRPGVDEFKSSNKMKENPRNVALRDEVGHILRQFGQIGVLVVPNEQELGAEAFKLLSKMSAHEDILSDTHEVFFDEGLFASAKQGNDLVKSHGGFTRYKLHFEKDSKIIAGIQLADLAAHTCAIMLSDEMGLIKKTVKAGENSGYEPDLDIELGFELWAGLRYNFLSEPAELPNDWDGNQEAFLANVEPFGLHISRNSEKKLRKAALKRFGQMYLGCIH